MTEAYIYDAIRTPRGKGKQDGALHSVKPISLLAGLMRELQRRHQLDTALIDDVLLGCATPVGDQGANLARIAALAAGWDSKVAGVQLNRCCASGLEAVNMAAQKVRAGWDDLVVAGGVESMSRVAPGADGGAWALDPETSFRSDFLPQGVAADLIAALDGHTREQLDAYALRSQLKAAAAHDAGRFRSVVPVRDQNGVAILVEDECIKPATTLAAAQRRTGDAAPAFDDIRDRLLYAQAIAALHCVARGAPASRDQADLISVRRCGFPAHTGGAIRFVQHTGKDTFAGRAAGFGARFAPPLGWDA